MARFWNALRDEVFNTVDDFRTEVLNTVDDFRTKGTVGTLRDAVLDAGDMAKDAGSWLVGGTAEDDAYPCVRSQTIPDGDDKVVVEVGPRQFVEGIVMAVDSASEPPLLYVEINGSSEPLLVHVLPPAQDPYEGLLTGIREEWESTVQDFKQKGAAGALKDAALDAGDMVKDVALDASDMVFGAAGTAYNGVRGELESTVQDFQQKGAAGALKDAALDASDMVFGAAGTAYNGVCSLASEVVSQVQAEPAYQDDVEYPPAAASSVAAVPAVASQAKPAQQGDVGYPHAVASSSPAVPAVASKAPAPSADSTIDAATSVAAVPAVASQASAPPAESPTVQQATPVPCGTPRSLTPSGGSTPATPATAAKECQRQPSSGAKSEGSTGKTESPASGQTKFKAAPPPGSSKEQGGRKSIVQMRREKFEKAAKEEEEETID
mmetsp:Transcript_6559/g.11398  ORF Transcript_6559/g.11398 Transcript_6559/m.11398 type:complete len:436 (-) Transcript_6559:26-1333(-)